MRDLADLARILVESLFDTYRPELHYMRGPGPKWRAKHEGTLWLPLATRPARPDHACVWPLASNCHSTIATLASVAFLVLGAALLVIALLVSAPTASKADASHCAQASDLAAARLRWAAARQSRADSAQNENRCRLYRFHFYDAVTARQVASICEGGINRQRDLDLLDSEIDAFNNLIATQCGG